jgi:HlyD family secretion protein
VIALGVVTAPFAYYFLQEKEIAVTAVTVSRGHVEQTITAMASGTVKPRYDSMVAGGTMGKVVAKPVKEGDRVRKGDVLVELDHAELDAQVALAEANLRVGTSRLEQAKIAATIYEEIARARVGQAEAQLKVAKLDFDRVQALSDRKAVSQSDFDKITLALRVSQETDSAAKASQQENLVRQEEIRSAEALIEQLQAALTLAKEMRDKAYVRAPFDGVVAKVFVELGEAVGGGVSAGLGASLGAGAGAGVGMGATSAGAPSAAGMSMASPAALLQLVQDGGFYVKAPFDEANASLIKAGQKARIGLDAYRGIDFPGKVQFVSPTVTRNLDLSRTLDIDVVIEEGLDKFIAGMSADIIIVAQEKDDVLFAPSESLVREEEAYVIENGRAMKRKVQIGIGNWQRKEILGGLREGETLISPVSIKGLKNGIKVRVVESLDET